MKLKNPVFAHRDSLEGDWLAESVKFRMQQTRSGLISASVMAVVLWYALADYFHWLPLALWLLAIIGSLVVRQWVVLRYRNPTGGLSQPDEIKQVDRKLRGCSILTQAAVGAGTLLCLGDAPVIAAAIITAGQLLHGTASMVNLSYDYRSFKYSLPFLLLPPALFWITQPGPGVVVTFATVFISWLMLTLVRRSEATLKETYWMRYRNLRLLEQVEAEQEKTQAALEEAQSANQMRAFFMAAASHDLRQPLFALSILTETMGLQDMSDGVSEIYNKQRRAIEVLRGLFDNLLDLSKFDSGQIDPIVHQVALEDMLLPIHEEFTELCADKGIEWRIEYPDIVVETDSELISRVIRNLLTNAYNFTDQGFISLRVEQHNVQAIFIVEDSGCGIAKSDQARVFDDFVQLNNSARLRSKGVGLGLAITKHINQLLKLGLTMDSRLGEGTTFRFEVPATEEAVHSHASKAIASQDSRGIQGKTIWVFEDEPMVREALQLQFDAWGSYVRFFSSSVEFENSGIDLDEERPDIILMDDMLAEGVSGLTLANRLADAGIAPTRILLMTGNSESERLQDLEGSQFLFAKKPVAGSWLLNWMLAMTTTDSSMDHDADREVVSREEA